MPSPEKKRYEVQLRVYDLSNGLVKLWSPVVLMKSLEGMWHTGINVYGYEYFYGGGIVKLRSSEVERQYEITPDKVITLGFTDINQKKFEKHLLDIRDSFSQQFYDLSKWNCNHFSNYIAQYLVGQGIPEDIVGLPDEVEQTLMGRLVMQAVRRWGGGASEVDPDHSNHPKRHMEVLGKQYTSHKKSSKRRQHKPQRVASPVGRQLNYRIKFDKVGMNIKDLDSPDNAEVFSMPASPVVKKMSKKSRRNRLELINSGWKVHSDDLVRVGSPSGIGRKLNEEPTFFENSRSQRMSLSPPQSHRQGVPSMPLDCGYLSSASKSVDDGSNIRRGSLKISPIGPAM